MIFRVPLLLALAEIRQGLSFSSFAVVSFHHAHPLKPRTQAQDRQRFEILKPILPLRKLCMRDSS